MDRKLLKARAHALHPILQLGEKGLTDAVVAEIDRALAHHELIKVRAAPLNRDEREVALASICERIDAQPVQHIGKIFVLYREKPQPEPPTEPVRAVRKPASRGAPQRAQRPQRKKPPQRRRPRR